MEKPKLYLHAGSPFCRTVMLTLKAINFNLEEVITNGGETRTPEFLKMNPEHTIPTLEDNGKYIVDSHVISVYLVNKYGKPEYQTLAPKDDLYERALLESRLHFNNSTLVFRLKNFLFPMHLIEAKKLDKETIGSVEEAIGILETFLQNCDYVCGNNLTVADFAIVTMISLFLVISPIDKKRFPKITGWLSRLSKLPYYDEIITKNANEFKDTLDEILKNKNN